MNKDNLVEKAMLQMKDIQELVAENAKGILASTMKEEINSLVKESLLSEQPMVDDEDEVDLGSDEMDVEEPDMVDDMEMNDMGDEPEMEEPEMVEPDEDVLDLRDVDNEETLLTVFKAMKEDDGIIVSKNGGEIHLEDENSDTEYLIKLGESIKKRRLKEEEMEEQGEDDFLDSAYEDQTHYDDDDSETYSWEEEDEEEEEEYDEFGEMIESDELDEEEMDEELDEEEMDEEEELEEEEMDEELDEEEMDEEETIYEIDMGDDMPSKKVKEYTIWDLEKMIKDAQKSNPSFDEWKEGYNEDYDLTEQKTKPKGMGMGSPSKFKYRKKPNQEGGFSTKKKEAPKTTGTGKAKFEYKEGKNTDGKMKPVKSKPTEAKKVETKEAARTYAMGSKEGRGLRKGITPNRNHVYENEIKALREKNEEYRKALNVIREKLNEVAVFNSNLAYATRLFTEHSTTKKEKINILRRFDSVETLKESKNLYNSIKNELAENVENNSLNESVKKISNTANTGSSVSLIESRTYENPQFLRMKDLMNKLK